MRLPLLTGLVMLVAATTNALPFTFSEVNRTTAIVPPPTGPACLPIPSSSQSLYGKSASIVVGDGSNADAFLSAYSYLHSRAATITVSCAPSSPGVLNTLPNVALLMRMHYPLYKINCQSMATWSASSYDIIIVPDGYTATLPMRQSPAVQQVIRDFIAPANTNSDYCSLFLVGGATELLIDSGVISVLNCSEQVPITTTPSLTTAVANRCTSANLPAPTHRLAFGRHNIIVGADGFDLPTMLANWESAYFNTSLPDLNCNNTNTTVPMDWPSVAYNSGVSNATDADWQTLAAATDASSSIILSNSTAGLKGLCTNGAGVDFCTNSLTSLVVAHGSHAREVLSFIDMLNTIGTRNLVFCPDDDEENSFGEGYVYLSSEPAYLPTHRLLCTAFYNHTELITSSLVIIAGGAVATHRRLRIDTNLVKAVQSTDTYNLYGSALAMLNAVLPTPLQADDVNAAPYYMPTNVDMSLLGFNASTAPSPVMRFRNIHKGATKVLGGYRNATDLEQTISVFMGQVAGSLVWENANSGIADPIVLIVVLGIAGIVIFGTVAVMCYRERSAVARMLTRRGTLRDDGLSMKFSP